MLKITQIKTGVLIEVNNVPYQVISASYQMLGRGHGMVRAKLKNLQSGATSEKVFRGGETIKEANLTKIKASYLYHDQSSLHFMENETMEQFAMPENQIGFAKNFLKEGTEIEIFSFLDKPISVNLPIKIELEVAETEPGIKGSRETAGTKKAILETGYAIQVPLFIKEGDIIKVDTRDGKYIERT
ncbi:MAG: elongation factor P [Candidatus Berkelbacteria bacterium]|nr:elongation factor P [Candidatus Berkelbacteria bacterium]